MTFEEYVRVRGPAETCQLAGSHQFAPFAPADLRAVAATFEPLPGDDPQGWPVTPF